MVKVHSCLIVDENNNPIPSALLWFERPSNPVPSINLYRTAILADCPVQRLLNGKDS